MNKSSQDRINYGLSLLKMLMAFEVLLSHFASWKEYDPRLVWPFRQLNSLAVPCFLIISFYLTAHSFRKRDNEKTIDRFKRLLIPQIFWAFIYYIIYAVIDLVLHKGLHSGISDLFLQLITGHSRYLNPSMWYQFDLIIVTLLFSILFHYLDDRKIDIVFIFLLAISYFLQFSGINHSIFHEMEFEFKYPLGRIVETIPYAIIGYYLRCFDIFNKLKKYRYFIMIAAVVLFLGGFYVPWPEIDDFGYGGLAKPYLSLCIIAFAFLAPFEYLNQKTKNMILKISDYTLGIYCIHRLINTLLQVFLPFIALRSIERCVLIYILSYFICFLLDQIKNPFIQRSIK